MTTPKLNAPALLSASETCQQLAEFLGTIKVDGDDDDGFCGIHAERLILIEACGVLLRYAGEGERTVKRDAMASLAAPHGWAAVCDDSLPPLDEIVWLWDGQRIWIGGRADDCDGWLWANTYGAIWHNGAKWAGDLETDDNYKPTHWMRLPEPPIDKIRHDGAAIPAIQSAVLNIGTAMSDCELERCNYVDKQRHRPT